jgi:uncharacterized protein YutE (UPF0331/DUF86 family)
MNSQNELKREILAEKEHITKTLFLLKRTLARPEKDEAELAAIGSFIHNVYTGIENMLKRILKFKQVIIPDSPSSHKNLLDQAVLTGIISATLSDELDDYRGFRHFFVHAYVLFLDEEQLIPLAENLPMLWKRFDHEIETFYLTFANLD